MQVVTRAELLDLLGSRRAFARALREGSWQRVLRGAYAPGSLEVDLTGRAQAVELLLPAHAVVADRCLLWLLGIDVLPAGDVVPECVVPRGAVVPRRAGVRVREGLLPAADVGTLAGSGLRALRPARAVADLLRLLPAVEAVVVVDAVLGSGLVTCEALQEELHNHARLRGVVQARRALELADPRAESPPESRLRFFLHQAGFPVVPQVEVRTAAGVRVGRVDLALPELRIAIEYDGRAVHERQDVFVHDRQRQNALVAEGWVVLRFTAADLRGDGSAVVATVRRAVLAQTRRTA
jgi:very-short-patch-repair endonuclease